MSAPSQQISHKEIARKLNLSRATVGNILRDKGNLPYKEETRRRVLDAARELGYLPNRSALAVRTGRSNLIGVIHFGGSLQSSRRSAADICRAISALGYDYLLINLHWHGGDIRRTLNEMAQMRVEGIVISLMEEHFGKEYTNLLKRYGIPVVSLYGNDALEVPLFTDDAVSVFSAMTRHLQSLGHRQLLLLTNAYKARTTRERMRGFREAVGPRRKCPVFESNAFLEAGFFADRETPGAAIAQMDLAACGHDVLTASYKFGVRLFRSGKWPRAIVCSNDFVAFGIFNAAHECGLRVPEDVALTGFDNEHLGHFPIFRLTTVKTDTNEASRAAVGELIRFIRGDSATICGRLFDSHLILRRSCGREDAEEVEVFVPHRKETAPETSGLADAASVTGSPVPASRLSCGFSLIEVTLTLGIIAFAFVAIMGMIPISADAMHNSAERVAQAHILQQISGDLQRMPYADFDGYLAADHFYDFEGKPQADAADSVFAVTLTREAAVFPGSADLAGLENHLRRVVVKIGRPGQTGTDGVFERALSIANPGL